MAPKDDKKIDFDDDYDEKETKSVFEEYVRSTIAEFIGTFFYVFIACLVVTSKNLIAMAFAEGLAIAVLCTAFINVSGGMFNPALTWAMVIAGGVNPLIGVMQFGVQTVAAMAGSGFCKGVLYQFDYQDINGGSNQWQGVVPLDKHIINSELSVSTMGAVITETIVCVFIFMVYLQANFDKKSKQVTGPLAYGFAVTCGILVGYHASGGSFNPARSFGSSAISGFWDEAYIYWAGPFVGASIAGLFYRLVLGDSTKRLFMKGDDADD